MPWIISFGVTAGGVALFTGDVIVNANGDLCRITAVTSTAYTVSKFGSIKGATMQIPMYGTTDMYLTGEYMVYTDGQMYKCLSNTSYSPEEYAQAWQIVNKEN